MKDFKISARQTGMLCVMLILANTILVYPSLLYEEVGSDGFWVSIFLLLFDLLVLGAFFILKARYPTEKFSEVLNEHLGKIIAKIIIFLFMSFFFIKSILTYTVVYMFLKQVVYQEDFEFLALVAILPIINHAVFCGMRTISRTIELFFYIICAGLVLCLAISTTNGGGMPLFFQAEAGVFFQNTFKHLFSFGDYIFLFLIMDKIEIKKKQGRKMLNIILFGVLLLVIILFRFYSIYRVTAFMHNNALIDISAVPAQFTAIGKLDIIPMITIMFLTYFQLEIFVYGFSRSFLMIFPKLNKIHSLILYDILFLVLYHEVIGQYDFFLFATENYLPYLMVVINLLVPLITTFISFKVRKRRKYEKVF